MSQIPPLDRLNLWHYGENLVQEVVFRCGKLIVEMGAQCDSFFVVKYGDIYMSSDEIGNEKGNSLRTGLLAKGIPTQLLRETSSKKSSVNLRMFSKRSIINLEESILRKNSQFSYIISSSRAKLLKVDAQQLIRRYAQDKISFKTFLTKIFEKKNYKNNGLIRANLENVQSKVFDRRKNNFQSLLNEFYFSQSRSESKVMEKYEVKKTKKDYSVQFSQLLRQRFEKRNGSDVQEKQWKSFNSKFSRSFRTHSPWDKEMNKLVSQSFSVEKPPTSTTDWKRDYIKFKNCLDYKQRVLSTLRGRPILDIQNDAKLSKEYYSVIRKSSKLSKQMFQELKKRSTFGKTGKEEVANRLMSRFKHINNRKNSLGLFRLKKQSINPKSLSKDIHSIYNS